ncbi:hypothetical protein LWI29_010358 [Acer saccharum]|uniref:Uncharacterized protein n=1 Tax=Acer saccharum TaxID=4024 RepID=A0AA39VIM9_ACESA|nr:hypothetical protein LWI29_010358 [Acer saccharum]
MAARENPLAVAAAREEATTLSEEEMATRENGLAAARKESWASGCVRVCNNVGLHKEAGNQSKASVHQHCLAYSGLAIHKPFDGRSNINHLDQQVAGRARAEATMSSEEELAAMENPLTVTVAREEATWSSELSLYPNSLEYSHLNLEKQK